VLRRLHRHTIRDIEVLSGNLAICERAVVDRTKHAICLWLVLALDIDALESFLCKPGIRTSGAATLVSLVTLIIPEAESNILQNHKHLLPAKVDLCSPLFLNTKITQKLVTIFFESRCSACVEAGVGSLDGREGKVVACRCELIGGRNLARLQWC